MKYKEKFRKYGERGQNDLCECLLIQINQKYKCRRRCSQVKMGLIDCPAIVQPDLSMPLPNEWHAKQGNATPCHLTQLLTNGRQAQEFEEDIKYGRRAGLSDFS